MNKINILDSETIDKIAAGEVVERPANIVKELVENSIDAGATSITVEIKDGGIALIRVTDNGSGIAPSELSKAFMRHATSKIKDATDLSVVESLGFRGEALSSISAVCQVEMITKVRDNLTGVKVNCNGGVMEAPTEVGAPDGTTIIARNIFYNTPVRKKFLKTPATEGNYISDIMQHIALSKPGISFQFIANGQTKFFTSGNGDLMEVIYRIYGKDTKQALVSVHNEMPGVKIEGYIGKPVLNRSNRNFETVFINGRYIKSAMICKALEEGYKGYIMQHKYPFCVLHFTIDTEKIDVNVHPTKMDVRILEPVPFMQFVAGSLKDALLTSELVPEVKEPTKEEVKQEKEELTKAMPQPFEKKRIEREVPGNVEVKQVEEKVSKPVEVKPVESVRLQEESTYFSQKTIDKSEDTEEVFFSETAEKIATNPILSKVLGSTETKKTTNEDAEKLHHNVIKQKDQIIIKDIDQLALFDQSIMTGEKDYEIVGQIFDTYWILAFRDKMYMVDQHAAHEKVKYEHFVRKLHEKQITSQYLNPPIIVTLRDKEKEVLERYFDSFVTMGFEIEEFGGEEYALRAVPTDLYGCSEKDLFLTVIDELVEYPIFKDTDVVLDKIASMSCKAAVKGNMKLSYKEAERLMEELLSLENPFQCPHGRPTIISMSKYEIEKKFKRIV